VSSPTIRFGSFAGREMEHLRIESKIRAVVMANAGPVRVNASPVAPPEFANGIRKGSASLRQRLFGWLTTTTASVSASTTVAVGETPIPASSSMPGVLLPIRGCVPATRERRGRRNDARHVVDAIGHGLSALPGIGLVMHKAFRNCRSPTLKRAGFLWLRTVTPPS
jgi:hypothetical protein